jgi:hypothetical protein
MHHFIKMKNHKYKVGDLVRFTRTSRDNAPSGDYEILRLLPFEGDRIQYRIKSMHENYDRVVGEEQLSARAQTAGW